MTGSPFFSASDCPCGSDRLESRCCGPVLRGAAASTAEDLMRSRYTAYVRHDELHLLASWHPSTRPDAVDFGAEEWLGLEILEVVGGGTDDDEGIVEFEARVEDLGEASVLHERSAFRRHRGRWVYVDAVSR